MAHSLLVRAAQLVEQARALNDEFEDKSKMPAEVAQRVDRLLGEASNCRKHWEREQAINNHDEFLHEPDHKHDMSYDTKGSDGATYGVGLAPGEHLTDKERNEARKKAFFEYVRKGDAAPPQVKADLVENATGELLVPADFAGTILKDLPRESVIRGLAFTRPTSSNKVDVGSVTIAAGGWGKLETGTLPTDGLGATPAAKDTITVYDLNALVKLGRDELDDADDDLAAIITEALTMKFGEQIDDAFSFGTGAGQPFGIGQRAVGAGLITQGVASAAGETVTGDELKRVIFQVPAWALRNAVWLGHKSAEEKIALLKDGNGNYLWQPRVSESEPATLMGYRWHRVDGLPAINATVDGVAAGTNPSVMFGDVRRGYMIAERRGLLVQRLSERYADEGKVGLLFTLRMGGDVIRPKAFAFYKI